jgi:hypothetical protein
VRAGDPAMRHAFLIVLASLPMPAFAATRSYSITGFEKIRVDGPYAVTLKLGSGGSAVATGEQHALDRLTMEVHNRTLVVQTSRSGSWGESPSRGGDRVTITLATPTLTAAALNGAGTLTIDRAKAQRFDLVVNGSGKIELGAVDSDRLLVSVVGSGGATLGGRALNVTAALQGGGSIDAARLAASDLTLTTSGTGEAHFSARRTAKITATGAGEVVVDGSPACTVSNVGTGDVRCGAGQ